MIFRTTLFLLFVNMASVKLWHYSPLGKCNFKYRLTIGQVIMINNPHWPGTYRAGETCRWTFDCPFGYLCNLRCFYISIPYTTGCSLDKLLVSTKGDPDFKDAELYCGRTYIRVKSVGTRIVMGLITGEHSPGGSFKCAVRTEPEMHIDSFINALGIKSEFQTLNRLRGHRLRLVDLKKLSSRGPQVDETTKYHFAFVTERQPNLTTTGSVIDAIIHAIGLVTPKKKKPSGRAAFKKHTTAISLKPVDILINSLGLNRRHNISKKRVTTTTTTPSPTTRKEDNATMFLFDFVTEIIPTLSIFDALIEAIA